MNRRIKQEFDQQTGTSPLLKKEDKERFHEWLQGKKNKRNKPYWIPQIMTALLIIGFVGVLYNVFGGSLISSVFDEEAEVRATFKNYFYDYFELDEGDVNLKNIEVGIASENDVIAIFTFPSEENNRELSIGYFKDKEEGQWSPFNGRGINEEDPVVWSTGEAEPYLYTGVTDEPVSEVMLGSKKANILSMEDGKVLWYATSHSVDEKVTVIMKSGKQDTIDEIPAPHDLLATEDGKYSALYVTDIVGGNLPDDLKSASMNMTQIHISPLSSAQGSYPALKIKQSPSYYFFNHEELVYKTEDVEKALKFAEEHDLIRRDE